MCLCYTEFHCRLTFFCGATEKQFLSPRCEKCFFTELRKINSFFPFYRLKKHVPKSTTTTKKQKKNSTMKNRRHFLSIKALLVSHKRVLNELHRAEMIFVVKLQLHTSSRKKERIKKNSASEREKIDIH